MTTYRSDYHREEDRDKQGGWKSWFGLGDKDEDRDRGYSYSKTTTYRDGQPQPSYDHSGNRYPERTGYTGNISTGYTTGARGGYGYTTTDEALRGQSWNADRDYTTRGGYGLGGDRDYTYRPETRTYGGDRDREYPSRSYGFSSSDQRPSSRGVYTSSGPYGYSSDQGRYTGDYSSRYPTGGDRDYTYTSRYPTDRDYTTSTTSRYQTGGDRDYVSRYPVTGGTYGGDYGRPYGGDYTSRYGYSDRDIGRYSGETRGNIGYGYGGDRDYTRSYQHTTRY